MSFFFLINAIHVEPNVGVNTALDLPCHRYIPILEVYGELLREHRKEKDQVNRQSRSSRSRHKRRRRRQRESVMEN